MADVFTELQAETEALAELAERHGRGPGPGPDITGYFARLTSTARLVRLSVENPGVFGVTPQISYDSLDEAILTWLLEQRKATALLAAAPKEQQLPWSDGPLRPSVLAAAVLTEVFAAGQDIADAFGVRPRRDDSIGHVAYYGVRTRDRAYLRRQATPPAEQFRFELRAPSGARWDFGPEDATDRVAGPAEDFCLLVTGRRYAEDLALTFTGGRTAEWLELLEG
ncbi:MULTISPECIES: maleylpyruvate isomerase family mycothiol-dependent enzyme [unclassified Amycolatopsis]|uniref:maleylpyruvate isomerase family mycothiol-dependent enzyme n=1 Tax=unclassified Amycolatopsis TaxID=2618356 RepID=UPI002E139CD0|nr:MULTISPECIES: maleylpyruvate isomerase family mycothiol-dependent enzyme [unclassified Amycolatopsis]WSJ72970.1 maleylpyruvate isomerase family mycothiol-dependent enzyme [Amycolatopsis sp. NBC_01307]WSK83303.1 maleylpyruvate isomerase family mycothiol-dependent enzyme [Amycolatopsis sp. NBC_01286]